MLLPEPRKPFMIKYPYRVRSDMYKLAQNICGYPENALFLVDSDYEIVTQESLQILKNYPQHSRVYLEDDMAGLTDCLRDIAATIAEDMPQYYTFENNQFTSRLNGLSVKWGQSVEFNPEIAMFPDTGKACYEHVKELAPFDQLCDVLRLSVEEDLVIGKVAPDYSSDVMECMLVTLPSKWDPLEKNGLTFADVHAPIPESERLIAASPRLVNAIMTRGDFLRYNWTISNNTWSRNPSIEGDYTKNDHELNQSIGDFQAMMQKVYFRSERQTLKAFPQHNRYLFVIHTYLHPLADMLTTADRQQQFLDVLRTLPRATSEHRGMVGTVIDYLTEALAENQAGTAQV